MGPVREGGVEIEFCTGKNCGRGVGGEGKAVTGFPKDLGSVRMEELGHRATG